MGYENWGIGGFPIGTGTTMSPGLAFFYSVIDFFSVPKVNSEDRKEAITKVIGGSKV